MARRHLPLLALAVLGAAAGPARAAAPPVPVAGDLVPRSCVADAGFGDGSPCATVPGLHDTAFLAVSPDGRNVYVTARESDTVTAFVRDPRTGALVRAKRGSCFAWTSSSETPAGCRKVAGIDRPSGIAVSPDGRGVYVAGNASHSVAAFRRDRRTGAIVPAGCFTGPGDGHDTACTPVPALENPIGLAVSRDGRNVYVTSQGTSGIDTFKRSARTAKLTYVSCLRRAGAEPAAPCADLQGGASLNWLALSRDGRNLYATASDSNSVLAFSRNPASGALASLGCLSGTSTGTGQATECAPARGLLGPQFVTVSPDGRSVYAAGSAANSIAVFTRGPGGALAQAADATSCMGDYEEGVDDCDRATGLNSPFGLALDPAGTELYTGAFGTGTIDTFRRDAGTGLVHYMGPCFAPDDELCSKLTSLSHAGYLEVSPDGRNVYASAPGSSAVEVFARRSDPPPVLPADVPATLRGTTLTSRISCPRSALLGCFGEVSVRVVDGRGATIPSAPKLRFDLRRGRRLKLNIRLNRRAVAALRATDVDAVRIDVTSREAAGGASTTPFLRLVSGG